MLLKSAISPFCLCLLFSCCPLPAQNHQSTFSWPSGKHAAVSLSFDDARASQIDVGLPLFDRYGAKVTFYVNPPNMQSRLAGWKQAAAEAYEIGNHSQTHPCSANFPWSRKNGVEDYTLDKMAAEMDKANSDTERLLGVKPSTFAYPCGQKFMGRGERTLSYVPLVAKRFLAGRGFRDEAANSPEYCDFAQLLAVDSDGLSFEEMKGAAIKARDEGAWLVFAGHEIGTASYQAQTTGAGALEQFLKYAQDPANGIWLDTVKAVATYVQAHRAGK